MYHISALLLSTFAPIKVLPMPGVSFSAHWVTHHTLYPFYGLLFPVVLFPVLVKSPYLNGRKLLVRLSLNPYVRMNILVVFPTFKGLIERGFSRLIGSQSLQHLFSLSGVFTTCYVSLRTLGAADSGTYLAYKLLLARIFVPKSRRVPLPLTSHLPLSLTPVQ